jgi:hypothetical protein
MKIINTTPHAIVFLSEDGQEFEVLPCGKVVSATPVEALVRESNGVSFVRAVFLPSDEGERIIDELLSEYGNDAILVGSIIAAQAYSGKVVGMCPAAGYGRRPVAEKRMDPMRFSTFE